MESPKLPEKPCFSEKPSEKTKDSSQMKESSQRKIASPVKNSSQMKESSQRKTALLVKDSSQMKSSQKDSSQVKDMSMSPDSTRSSSDSSESERDEDKEKKKKTRSPKSEDKTRRSGSGKLKNPSPLMYHCSFSLKANLVSKRAWVFVPHLEKKVILCANRAPDFIIKDLGVFTQTRAQIKNSVMFRFINWFLSQLTNWFLLQFFVLSHSQGLASSLPLTPPPLRRHKFGEDLTPLPVTLVAAVILVVGEKILTDLFWACSHWIMKLIFVK